MNSQITSYHLNYSPWLRWLLVLTWLGPRRVRVELSPYGLQVHSLYFTILVPLEHIASVTESSASRWALAGVHTDTGGTWTVNGAPGSITAIDMAAPVSARVMGLTVHVRRLELGLSDAQGFRTSLASLRGSAT